MKIKQSKREMLLIERRIKDLYRKHKKQSATNVDIEFTKNNIFITYNGMPDFNDTFEETLEKYLSKFNYVEAGTGYGCGGRDIHYIKE